MASATPASRLSQIIDNLIASGRLDVELPKPHDGCSVLTFLVETQKTDLALRLIQAGADIHHKSSVGYQAIHAACALNDIVVLNELLSRGASLHAKTRDKTTAFHYAFADKIDPEVINLVLDSTTSPMWALLQRTKMTSDHGSCWDVLARHAPSADVVLALEILDGRGLVMELLDSRQPAYIKAAASMASGLSQRGSEEAIGWLSARARASQLQQSTPPSAPPRRSMRL